MSQETSEAAWQKIVELLRKTKEMNEKYERKKWEHQEHMKAKEKEKEKQMEERARMKESSSENVATVSSVIVRT